MKFAIVAITSTLKNVIASNNCHVIHRKKLHKLEDCRSLRNEISRDASAKTYVPASLIILPSTILIIHVPTWKLSYIFSLSVIVVVKLIFERGKKIEHERDGEKRLKGTKRRRRVSHTRDLQKATNLFQT